MAKIQGGALAGEMRGSLGSTVFSRNPHGAYTKTRTAPDPWATDRRDTTQMIWAQVAERWNLSLTDQQRNAWHVWSMINADSKSPIGPKALNGRSAFMRLNQRLGLYGASYIDDPPPGQPVTQLTNLELAADADTQNLSLTFAPSPLPANHAMQVWTTPNLNVGRMAAGDKYQFLCYLDPGATSPADISADWLAREWPTGVTGTRATQTILPGKKIFIRARLLNTANGAYSVYQIAAAAVTGTGDAMLAANFQLSDEQIKALPSTPIQILPSPGAGKLIIVHRLVLWLTGPTSYTNINADDSELGLLLIDTDYRFGPTVRNLSLSYLAQLSALLSSPTFFFWNSWDQQPSSVPISTQPWITTPENPYGTSILDKPILLYAINPDGNFTGGDPSNLLKGSILYTIITM